MSAKDRVLLFDLDGTLIDSIPLILASLRFALTEHGVESPDDDTLISGIGTPLRTQLFRYTPEAAQVEAMFLTYKAHNLAHHDASIRAFEGIVEVVEALRARGAILGVVTSKMRDIARRGLEISGLSEAFPLLIGLEDTERHKPDPDPVIEALRRLSASAANATYIGDSPHDLRAGRRAGVRTVGVKWGPFPLSQLEDEAPDLLFDRPGELITLLD